MKVHKNARLTPQGRLPMVRRIEEQGWTVAAAADARENGKADHASLDPDRLVFGDETGISTKMVRLRGRGPRSVRLVGRAPLGHWKTTIFAASLRRTGLVSATSRAVLLLRPAQAAQKSPLSPLPFARLGRLNPRHRRRIGHLLQPEARPPKNAAQIELQWAPA